MINMELMWSNNDCVTIANSYFLFSFRHINEERSLISMEIITQKTPALNFIINLLSTFSYPKTRSGILLLIFNFFIYYTYNIFCKKISLKKKTYSMLLTRIPKIIEFMVPFVGINSFQSNQVEIRFSNSPFRLQIIILHYINNQFSCSSQFPPCFIQFQ